MPNKMLIHSSHYFALKRSIQFHITSYCLICRWVYLQSPEELPHKSEATSIYRRHTRRFHEASSSGDKTSTRSDGEYVLRVNYK